MTNVSRIARNKYIYLMLLPGLFITVLFSYVPASGFYMAFSDFKIGRPILSAKYVGFKHFKEILLDSSGDIFHLMRNTIAMNVISLVLCLSVAMFFAILLNEARAFWFRRLVQTASLFPDFMMKAGLASISAAATFTIRDTRFMVTVFLKRYNKSVESRKKSRKFLKPTNFALKMGFPI